MPDEQIIERLTPDLDFERTKRKSLQADLKAKEKEYEELRQYHNKCCQEFENEKQALLEKYNQVSINFYNGDYCNTEHCSLLKAKEQECEKLKQTLIEIKPALELYANSKIGEEQPDGTYKIIVEDSKVFGGMCITFNPKPAKQALQKISEVEDEHNG